MYDTTPNTGSPDHGEFGDDAVAETLADRELLVVSNRQPYAHNYDGGDVVVDGGSGGLAGGLDPFLRQSGGTWIAWGDGDADRTAVDDYDRVRVPPDDPAYDLRRVWLSEADVRKYYYGFSNRVLWPICHGFLGSLHAESGDWQRYRDVNAQFADVVTEELSGADDPIVWFQDYHLALAPRLVRRSAPADVDVAHFWHVPWPAWDTFRACPHGRAVLRGLLGNDVIGFHVERYRTQFLRCVDRALDGATVDHEAGRVSFEGETTTALACPLGVEADRIERLADASATADAAPSFGLDHKLPDDATIAVGVERLDYTKGIPERLRALERVWESDPEWRGELTYVQKASESRSRIPEYREIQDTVESEVERINDRFGTDDWTPIAYTTDYLSEAELYGLYRRADVAVVSPLCDGLNLVASEFVAAQGDDPGVLVLSDQAGIHDRLGRFAHSVSPFEIGGFADAIRDALTTSAADRRRRMAMLRDAVEADSLSRWVRTFVAAVAGPERTRRSVSHGST